MLAIQTCGRECKCYDFAVRSWVHVQRPGDDTGGSFPAVIFFHHGPGFDAGSEQAVKLIADAGYLVVALDRYRRFEPWAQFDMSALRDPNPDNPERARFMSMITGTNDEHVQEDVTEIFAALPDEPGVRPGPVGCIGYCIGARSVLRTMRDHADVVAAGVLLHPAFCVTAEPDSPHRSVSSLRGELYLAVGSADQLSPLDENRPLIDAVAALGERGVVDVHEGADHGFAVPGSPSYQEAAATRSYEQALALFGKVL